MQISLAEQVLVAAPNSDDFKPFNLVYTVRLHHTSRNVSVNRVPCVVKPIRSPVTGTLFAGFYGEDKTLTAVQAGSNLVSSNLRLYFLVLKNRKQVHFLTFRKGNNPLPPTASGLSLCQVCGQPNQRALLERIRRGVHSLEEALGQGVHDGSMLGIPEAIMGSLVANATSFASRYVLHRLNLHFFVKKQTPLPNTTEFVVSTKPSVQFE